MAGLEIAGRKHVGALGGVILLLARAGTAGQLVQGAYQSLAQSLPFIERTQEAIERYEDSTPVYGEQPLTAVGHVAFEGVSFGYRPDTPVLSDITFEVQGEEVIGIIGPSGAGKSTLVQLLLQLRAPDHGRYLINGVPADQFAREDWHKQVSYVPQEPRLLHATVAENIRFFRDIELDAVRARREARAHPRRHDRLDARLRHGRRPARRRGLRRPAAAHLPGPGARGAAGGARPGRADERAGPALGDPHRRVADGAQAAS